MLLILIPTFWLVIAALFVVLCRAAACGDEALMSSHPHGVPSQAVPGLTLFESQGIRTKHDERLGRRPSRPAGASTRGRRARCVTG